MDSLSGCMPILFTRIPVPGYVKTRLSGLLSPGECAELQEALALDLVERIAPGCSDLVLCYSDEWEHVRGGAALRDGFVSRVCDSCAPGCRVHLSRQRGEGLGARLVAAIAEVFEAGADSCVLFGSDLPDLSSTDLARAAEALSRCDVVLGPGEDGGYWIVGLKEPFPEMFTRRRFSTETVLDEALATCREHGRRVQLIRTAMDVDEPADIERLCHGGATAGPRTAKALSRMVPDEL